MAAYFQQVEDEVDFSTFRRWMSPEVVLSTLREGRQLERFRPADFSSETFRRAHFATHRLQLYPMVLRSDLGL